MRKVLFTSLSLAVVLAVLAAQTQAATTIAHYRFENTSGPYIDETGNNTASLASNGTDLHAIGGANNLVDGGNGSMVGGGQGGGTGAAFAATSGTTLPQWQNWGEHHTVEFSYNWNGTANPGQNLIMGSNGGGGDESTYWIQTPSADTRIGIEGRVKPPGPGAEGWNSYVDLATAQGLGAIAGPGWVDIAIVFKMNDPNGNKLYVNGMDLSGTAAHSFDVSDDSPALSTGFGAWGIGGQAWDAVGPWDAWTFSAIDEVRISEGARGLVGGADQLLMYPEPGTMTLLTLGGLMLLRRRRA